MMMIIIRWWNQMATMTKIEDLLNPSTDVCQYTKDSQSMLNNNNNNNNTNMNDNVYGAVIATQSLWEFTRFIWRTQTSARRTPTLRPWRQSQVLISNLVIIKSQHRRVSVGLR